MKSHIRSLDRPGRGRFVLAISRADEDIEAAANYVAAIELEVGTPGGQGIFCFNHEDLLGRQAVLLQLLEPHDSRLAAALHVVVDGGGTQWLQGAIVNPAYRGRGLLKVLAATARIEREGGAGIESSRCVVRLYPDGTVNLPSFRSFTAVGVLPLPGEGRVALRGDRHDSHLFARAEQDGAIRYLTLSGDESTRHLAIAELSKWRHL